MPNAKNGGKRVPLRKVRVAYVGVDSTSWDEIEETLGIKISDPVREDIEYANKLYAKYSSRHSKQNTVPLSEITSSIRRWLEATERLQTELRVHELSSYERFGSREEIIGSWRAKKLKKALPLEFLAYSTNCAHASATQVLSELRTSTVGPIRADMWCAWVCLVALALKKHGVKFSAASKDKGDGSKFVKAIEQLQSKLPPECQIVAGYESIAKYVQRAKKGFGHATAVLLAFMIKVWGSGLPLPIPSEVASGNIAKNTQGVRIVLRLAKDGPVYEL